MKLKLGPKAIDLRRVSRVTRAGHMLAKIHFHTAGDGILVRCPVQYPDSMRFTFIGTVGDLQALVASLTTECS